MTEAEQLGRSAYQFTVNNIEYAVDSSGVIVKKIGDKLVVAREISYDVRDALMKDPKFAKVADAWGWTKNSAGQLVDSTGDVIGGFWGEAVKENSFFSFLNDVGRVVGAVGKKATDLVGRAWEGGKQGVRFSNNGLDAFSPGAREKLKKKLMKDGKFAFNVDEHGKITTFEPPVLVPNAGVSTVTKVETDAEKSQEIVVAYGDGKKETLTEDKMVMLRNFAMNQWDNERGFKLKVLKENSTDPSERYYTKTGTEYFCTHDAKRRIVSFENTALQLPESAYEAAIKAIYERDIEQGKLDPAFESAIAQYPFMRDMVAKRKTINTPKPENVPQPTPQPEQTGERGLTVMFNSPAGTGQFDLTAEQVDSIRNFVAQKSDSLGGYKLAVWTDDGKGLSPIYYKHNKAKTALCRHGDPSEKAMAFSTSTFKLNETQMHAALLAIAQRDAKNGVIDNNIQTALNELGSGSASSSGWVLGGEDKDGNKDKENGNKSRGQIVQGSDGRFYEIVNGEFKPVDTKQTQIIQGADGKLYQAQGNNLVPVKAQGANTQGQLIQGANGQLYQMGPNGQMVPVQGQGVQEDNRNFFLSAGNWINNSLFGSIASFMPFDLLKKAMMMLGNCIGGLFKAVGYAVEGEWSKAGNELFGWVKDVAITGGIAYGAYWLGKKTGFFGSDEKESSSTSSSSSSNTSGIEDIIKDALANSNNNSSNNSSNNSGSSSGTTQDKVVTENENVYVGITRKTYGEVVGTVQTYTDPKTGTTNRLISTSDRFLTTGAIQDADSGGTVWRVQLDNRKNQK